LTPVLGTISKERMENLGPIYKKYIFLKMEWYQRKSRITNKETNACKNQKNWRKML
jgi:hypothetical protein